MKMFNPRRHLLLAGLAFTAPAAAQLLGGQPLGGVTQTVREVGGAVGQTLRNIGEATGQTVGRVDTAVGGLVATNGSPLAPQVVEQIVTPGESLGTVLRPVGGVTTDAQTLLQLRNMRHAELIGLNRDLLEAGDAGVPVRRARLLLTNPTAAQVEAAAKAGFPLLGTERDDMLGLTVVTIGTPANVPARKALKTLENAVPGIPADVDPLFEPAGGGLAPIAGAALAGAAGATSAGARIAIVDGGVAAHPSMARASIEQKGFNGRAEATGHGTAVASLLVGEHRPFRGAARGTSLFVADIYGGNPAAGSASAIARALSWAASKRPQVITMSLVGPPNVAIERAIGAVRRMGIKVVAAVGNDGPAAPPAYPASYDGVLSVTGVDARGRALAEAGRPRHLDVAAPGAAMAAALPGQGYASVRGTSFAAPLAAARLMSVGSVEALSGEAVPGKGRVGRGIVCSSCRIAPSVVGAK